MPVSKSYQKVWSSCYQTTTPETFRWSAFRLHYLMRYLKSLSTMSTMNFHSKKMISSPNCTCCGSSKVELIGKLRDTYSFAGHQLSNSIPGESLYSCVSCKLKFRYPILEFENYKHLYDNKITTNWDMSINRNDWIKIIKYLNDNFFSNDKILDFGCNTGKLLAFLDNKFEKFGIEINTASANVAINTTGGQVWKSIKDVPHNIQFNAIVLSDVIEHIINPRLLISELKEKLNPNGVLIITTGDSNNFLWNIFGSHWWYCSYPEHLSFISKPWLDFICTNENLTLIKLECFKYINLSKVRLMIDSLFMLFFGVFPRSYNFLGLQLKRILRKKGDVPIRGVGVSKDHIFIVLKKSI